jgi:hypothetical protein
MGCCCFKTEFEDEIPKIPIKLSAEVDKVINDPRSCYVEKLYFKAQKQYFNMWQPNMHDISTN